MANTFRYLYGETNPVSVPYKAAVAVEIGDLCWIDSADSYKVKPAGSFTWNTSLAQTQTDFHPTFAGVAAQGYDGTNANAYGIKDGQLRIDTDGVFEFDTASASYNVGDLVGPAKQTGNLLEPQKVAAVASEALAVGRVVEATSSSTKVKVRIFPAKALVQS